MPTCTDHRCIPCRIYHARSFARGRGYVWLYTVIRKKRFRYRVRP